MKLSAYSSPMRVADAAFRHGMNVRGGSGAAVISAASKTTTEYTRALDSSNGYNRTFMPHGLQHGSMPAGGAGGARTVSQGYGVFIADGQSIHTFSKVADLRTQRRAPKVERRMPSKRAAKLYRQRASSSAPRIKPRKSEAPKRDWRVVNRKAVERFAKIAKEAAVEAAPRKRYSIVPHIAKLHSPPVAIAGVAPMQIATLTTEGNAQAQAMAQSVEVAAE